jgi:hypothetical protein
MPALHALADQAAQGFGLVALHPEHQALDELAGFGEC